MKKFKRIAVSALALLLAGATFPACKGDSTSKDPKTINVKAYKAGWGDEWMYELEKAFEAAYADEGYKVNIIAPSSDMAGSVVLNELYSSHKSGKSKVDLYITGNIQAAAVGSQNSYDTGAALVEDLEALVYNQKAIKYDGTEEDKTVVEKISPTIRDWIKDTQSYDSDKKYYGLPYIASNAGLVVNAKKLAEYGYTETPRTSDEVIEMATNIYIGKKKDGSTTKNADNGGYYPFTYFNNEYNAGGYGITWMYAMIAQYDFEAYEKISNFTEKVDGQDEMVEMKTNGYDALKCKAVETSLEFMEFVYDPVIASPGSTTNTMDQGQASLMKSGARGAIFMANGDWMLNEVRLNYKNELNDITFVNYPVNSAIGEEEFADLNDAKKADEIMSYIISLVDQNMEIDAIVEKVAETKSYTVKTSSVERIAKARGLHYSRGIEAQAFIPKDADATKKEIAAKFLRMLASDDAAKTIAQKANGTSMFASTVNENTDKTFVKEASKFAVNKYATPYRWFTGGLRKKMGLSSMFPEGSNILAKIYLADATMFNKDNCTISSDFSVYTEAANKLLTNQYETLKGNWADNIKKVYPNG